MQLFVSWLGHNDNSVRLLALLLRYYDLTINRTVVIDAAKYELSFPSVFFYCENEPQAALDASSILSSFIRQLCEFLDRTSISYPKDVAKGIRKFFGHKRLKPDLDDLKDIFTPLFPLRLGCGLCR